MEKSTDNAALSFNVTLCCTRRLECSPYAKENFPFPEGTTWFDANLELDGIDCSDDEVNLILRVIPRGEWGPIDDRLVAGPSIVLLLGRFDHEELKSVLNQFTEGLKKLA